MGRGRHLQASRVVVLACVAAGVSAIGLTAAESRALAAAQISRARMRFEEMDRNRDGRISRAEWRGSARSFAVHDWNDDGVLSGAEVGLERRWPDEAAERADHEPSNAERYMSWTSRGFATLDHDRNRRITPNEWHYDRETFLRVDHDRDGTLDRTEFLGGDMDDDRGDRFDDIDADGDGRIARREWHASNDAFSWLDRNRDGWLSRTEVVGDDEPATRDRERAIVVDARERWTDTGIDVRAGDVLTIAARGSIVMSGDERDTATPAGSRTGRGAQEAPVQAVAGALIARIDRGAPFLVGDQTSITARESGRLYLGVNDDHLPDNRGQFDVTVSLPWGGWSRR